MMENIPIIGWAVLVIAFLLWEGLGLRSPRDSWPTFTDIVRKIPKWVTGGFLLWLAYHFLLEQ